MFLRQLLLFFIGICAGGIIAAGASAFLAIIGVFPRLIGKTKTKAHLILFESALILGGVWGNVSDLYEIPLFIGKNGEKIPVLCQIGMALFGLGSGMFVGCLVMSLAETLKVIPVMNRRMRLAVGLPCLVLAVALGKMTGSLIYFLFGMGMSS